MQQQQLDTEAEMSSGNQRREYRRMPEQQQDTFNQVIAAENALAEMQAQQQQQSVFMDEHEMDDMANMAPRQGVG